MAWPRVQANVSAILTEYESRLQYRMSVLAQNSRKTPQFFTFLRLAHWASHVRTVASHIIG